MSQDQGAVGGDQRRGSTAVHLPEEVGLVAVRSTGVRVHFGYGPTHLGVGCAVGRFEIDDLLVGGRCAPHRFLARSYDADRVVRHASLRHVLRRAAAALGQTGEVHNAVYNPMRTEMQGRVSSKTLQRTLEQSYPYLFFDRWLSLCHGMRMTSRRRAVII